MFQLNWTFAAVLMLALSATAQQAQKQYDAARCTPKVQHQRPLPKDVAVAPRSGEKSSGYTPLISLQILESGEVVNTRVKRSSGFANVDNYALQWVRGTKYNVRPGCGTIETNIDVLIHWK